MTPKGRTAGTLLACLAATILPLGGPARADHAIIRPGILVDDCTLNFIFGDVEQRLFAMIAGHCYGRGQRVAYHSDNDGPLGNGVSFGTVVFNAYTNTNNDITRDCALIAIDESQYPHVDPSMLGWGGPTGYTTSSETAQGDVVLHYGNGVVVGTLEPTRARLGSLVRDDEKTWSAVGVAAHWDSGSPVLDAKTGKALGMLNHIIGNGSINGTTTERCLSLAANAGYDLTIQTAPYTPPDWLMS